MGTDPHFRVSSAELYIANSQIMSAARLKKVDGDAQKDVEEEEK